MNFIVIVTCIAGTIACNYLPSSGMRVPLQAESVAACQKKAEHANGYSNLIHVHCVKK